MIAPAEIWMLSTPQLASVLPPPVPEITKEVKLLKLPKVKLRKGARGRQGE